MSIPLLFGPASPPCFLVLHHAGRRFLVCLSVHSSSVHGLEKLCLIIGLDCGDHCNSVVRHIHGSIHGPDERASVSIQKSLSVVDWSTWTLNTFLTIILLCLISESEDALPCYFKELMPLLFHWASSFFSFTLISTYDIECYFCAGWMSHLSCSTCKKTGTRSTGLGKPRHRLAGCCIYVLCGHKVCCFLYFMSFASFVRICLNDGRNIWVFLFPGSCL